MPQQTADVNRSQLFLPRGLTRPGLTARSIAALRSPVVNDPTELLKHRYLSQGGALLIVGPTGIGKSSASLQCMLTWALGQDAFHIEPARPLRSLLIQAENDEGDLAEMRDGVIRGLALNGDEETLAMSRIFVHQESASTSNTFFNEIVRPLLAAHSPDLLWIDPALAFIGGDTSSQNDVGGFLRNGLHPLLREFNCGAVIIHHTNKPFQRQRKGSRHDATYGGSGSSEWANWCRAVLSIESTSTDSIYKLVAGKRGQRLRWENGEGERIYERFIRHSITPNEIFWTTATEAERSAAIRTSRITEDDVLRFVPQSAKIEKNQLIETLQDELNLGEKRARSAVQRLEGRLLFIHKERRSGGGRHEVYLSRTPPEPWST